ncbi:iron ABC transporter permease [Acinetobacter sp. Ac_877]|uniref:FecR family protein n=1 Tax=Acinetobacter portensis TaxID=1839785 RepID=UPI00128CA62A|nr:FecR domain-containing protein [Acinetobacter portensis]MPW40517.1 iron ABC transporter permease [Acinetobacter portensis]
MAIENKHESIHQHLIQEAAEWLVLLSSDDLDIQQEAQLKFNEWKLKSKDHLKIGTDIEHCLNSIQKLGSTTQHKKIAKTALNAGLNSGKQYKHILSTTALACVFFIACYGYMQFTDTSIGYLTADIKSNSNAWTTTTLKDGSQLILRGKSAVNITFNQEQRSIELVQGQMYVDVAKDKTRPFIVETSHGSITALGTAFSVAYSPSSTELKMLHSKVRVESLPLHKEMNRHLNSTVVRSGQGVEMNQQGIQAIQEINVYNETQKWKKHKLLVENLSLSKVLKELDQNYQGKIIFNKQELENIKVSAVLPLDQTQDALQLLNTVFPNLAIKKITPYLIVISLKN